MMQAPRQSDLGGSGSTWRHRHAGPSILRTLSAAFRFARDSLLKICGW